MGLSSKQYEALRSAKVAEARQHGISEAQLEDYEGELFDGEREYLIRKNPPGASKFHGNWDLIFAIAAVVVAFIYFF